MERVEAWQGNLPCVHSATGGCLHHNPLHAPIFYDGRLLAAGGGGGSSSSAQSSGGGGGLLRSLFGKKDQVPPQQQQQQQAWPADLQVWSDLSRASGSATETLPALHPHVPWSLARYHVHAAVSTWLREGGLQEQWQQQEWRDGGDSGNPRLSSPPPPSYSATTPPSGPGSAGGGGGASCRLTALSCTGTRSGSRPRVDWRVTSRVSAGGRFLVEAVVSFCISPPGEGGVAASGQHHRFSKNWFVSRGYAGFAPCAHMSWAFRSVRVEQRGGAETFRAGVEFALRNVLGGQEVRDEWRPEEEEEHEGEGEGGGRRRRSGTYCGMCATDAALTFALARNGSGVVSVMMTVYKDLGRGVDPGADAHWAAAMGRGSLRRQQADFGTVRTAFFAASAQAQPQAQKDREPRAGWSQPDNSKMD